MHVTKDYRTYGIYFVFLLVGFLIGLGISYQKKIPTINLSETRLKGRAFTSPLLECEPENASSLLSVLSVKNNVQKVIDKQIKTSGVIRVGVYFRDMNNGPWFGINKDVDFAPASMLKVPILMYYLKKAETNPSILNTVYAVKVADEGVSPNFKPTFAVKNNEVLTVKQLLDYMILYSDNNAKNTLLEHLDDVKYTNMLKEIGVEIASNPDGTNFMTVQEYASFFRVLYNASYIDKDSSEKALTLLSKTDFKSGLVAGIPKSVPIAHKFGERRYTDMYGNVVTQLHDCGIVYYPNKPYLICIMTQGSDFPSLKKTIQEVSTAVYKSIKEF
ncbi:MAG: class A beta-lactamase-related serine hydrolase [Candidatus Roizmanbacteria bacterium]|nr:class A beta-lactamase-related serine hydrolase [Candidatus Roizmanbacteria bacterium]